MPEKYFRAKMVVDVIFQAKDLDCASNVVDGILEDVSVHLSVAKNDLGNSSIHIFVSSIDEEDLD